MWAPQRGGERKLPAYKKSVIPEIAPGSGFRRPEDRLRDYPGPSRRSGFSWEVPALQPAFAGFRPG